MDSWFWNNSVGLCSIENKFPFEVEGIRYWYDWDKAGIEKSMDLLSKGHIVFNWGKFLEENNITKIDYLKIDCEGAEYDIIESLDKDYLTNNVNKICLEYHFNKGQLVTLINKLKECNFKINFEFGDHQINDELGIIYAYK